MLNTEAPENLGNVESVAAEILDPLKPLTTMITMKQFFLLLQ